MPRSGNNRRAAWAAAAAAATLAVAACGTGAPNLAKPDYSSAPGSPSASPSDQAVSSSKQVFPLTGLPASSAGAARPAIALLVDGTDPQGLGTADVVYQEATAPTRYIAVYQSKAGTGVGPITSTQPSDRQVLSQLHPVLGYDGAASTYIIKSLDKTTITDAGYATQSGLYTTAAAGLTTSTQAIASAGGSQTAPPQLFTYRGVGPGGSTLATAGQFRPSSVTVTGPGLSTEHWTFSQHSDRWTLASGGPRVQVANLVIQTVAYSTHVINAHKGISVPLLTVVGSGRAQVFSSSVGGSGGGTGATGTWSRQHSGQVTNYFDSGGTPMAFQPGPTWVILAPPGSQLSTSK